MEKTFTKNVKQALNNPVLRANYRKALDALAEKRKTAFADISLELPARREAAYALRLNSLHKLPELLSQLEQKLNENGIHVHWAQTPQEANQIAESILRQNNAKKIIKGKSMITEEIRLNDYLEEHGFNVIESDLGEFIVQLAGEKPAHIVAPIIYKNKEQVAKLFAEKLNFHGSSAEELTHAARQFLRKEFYSADAGLSGVNFAVAQTGTLCLVENEGNGRFCTTIPPLHIAFMSLEKVVEKFSDVPLLYSMLCRSASGQKITVYFNMISKPRQKDEKDGPQHVHLIILDNNRSTILSDPLLRKTLLCIRCGACMNNCPVYTNIGGHAYDAAIPGPIGKILMPQIAGMEKYGHLATASSLCAACVEVCPVKIPITDILLKLRAQATSLKNLSFKQRLYSGKLAEKIAFMLWAYIFSSPLRYKLFLKMLHAFPALIPLKVRFTPMLRQWTKTRDFPMPR